MNDENLDLRGLKCPLPALFARRALERAAPGTVIAVWVDDPMAPLDVPHMCHGQGYEVLECVADGNSVRLKLRKPA